MNVWFVFDQQGDFLQKHFLPLFCFTSSSLHRDLMSCRHRLHRPPPGAFFKNYFSGAFRVQTRTTQPKKGIFAASACCCSQVECFPRHGTRNTQNLRFCVSQTGFSLSWCSRLKISGVINEGSYCEDINVYASTLFCIHLCYQETKKVLL